MKMGVLCYVRSEGKTLMLHRTKRLGDPQFGKWNGLGGKMEKGESPEETLVREVFEESGLQLQQQNLHGVLTFPEFRNDEDWLVFVYSANNFEGELTQDPPEGRLEWVDDDKLLGLNLHDADKTFLPWVFEGKPTFSAKFTYEGELVRSRKVHFYPPTDEGKTTG